MKTRRLHAMVLAKILAADISLLIRTHARFQRFSQSLLRRGFMVDAHI